MVYETTPSALADFGGRTVCPVHTGDCGRAPSIPGVLCLDGLSADASIGGLLEKGRPLPLCPYCRQNK